MIVRGLATRLVQRRLIVIVPRNVFERTSGTVMVKFNGPNLTFGGGQLDRVAHLRGNSDEIATMGRSGHVAFAPFWRGRPLLRGDALGVLEMGHPLAVAVSEQLFLGIGGDTAYFAGDIGAWEPQADERPDAQIFFDTSIQHHPQVPTDHGFGELRAVMARLSPLDAEIAATAKALLSWHETHRFCARCGSASRIVMSGWQRECTACGTSHFPRTDPVVIMLVTRGNNVLLGRSPGWPEGMYSLLAGFMEPGETLETAVRREVFEETGVRVGDVGYMATQPWPFPASLMIGCSAKAESDEITLDPNEIEDALWLSREDLADVMAGVHLRIRQPRRGAIAQYLMSRWLEDAL